MTINAICRIENNSFVGNISAPYCPINAKIFFEQINDDDDDDDEGVSRITRRHRSRDLSSKYRIFKLTDVYV